MVAHIINFQERHCGILSPKPCPFTRFPFEIFRDYKIHGHLHRLLRFMISYCASQEWYKQRYQFNTENRCPTLIDLCDDSLSQQYYHMFQHIEHQLQKQQIIKQKIIYFSPLLPISTQQHLAKIATAHGAIIADQHTANVSHVCHVTHSLSVMWAISYALCISARMTYISCTNYDAISL